MEKTPNKYVTVAYELFTDNERGIHELVEKAPVEHPFQFITGMGVTLDAFEEKIVALNEGDEFDFHLDIDEAYGDYDENHVKEIGKELFSSDGHFDKETIYPGAVLPFVNEDGNHFHGVILEIKGDKVVVDFNHPLAGKPLHFKGQIVTMRPATNEEIEGMANLLSGEGCGCGCDSCGENHCHHDHEHHAHGDSCCERHQHGEHNEDTCCHGGHCHS